MSHKKTILPPTSEKFHSIHSYSPSEKGSPPESRASVRDLRPALRQSSFPPYGGVHERLTADGAFVGRGERRGEVEVDDGPLRVHEGGVVLPIQREDEVRPAGRPARRAARLGEPQRGQEGEQILLSEE